MGKIELYGVTKAYGKNKAVIEDMNLTVSDGSFTVLLGPSGCGKSTLLRIIAGLEEENGGDVFIDGENMRGVEPGRRGLAMVFQNYALYPTMSVCGNVEFGLKNMKVPKAEREERVAEALRMVDMEQFSERKPRQLSGGQCQRVALARAIVKKPRIFLMDEPLSNLDAKLRTQIRADLIELYRRLGTTFLYVTHDQTEAMSMGTEIILLEAGRIRQQDNPGALYNAPKNLFSARFIGSPAMNIVEARLFAEVYPYIPGNASHVGFRPERVGIAHDGNTPNPGEIRIPGEIVTRESLGDRTLYKFMTDFGHHYVKTHSQQPVDYGPCAMSLDIPDLHYFGADGERIDSDGVDAGLWFTVTNRSLPIAMPRAAVV
jgi:sn-glycerol 3-phosphate transport system ATP-binding protein